MPVVSLVISQGQVSIGGPKSLITIGMGGAPGPAGATAVVSSRAATYAETAVSGTNISLCDATAGQIVITLPSAVANAGIFTIKKKDATANTLVITPTGGQKIDGGTTATIAYQYESITFISDGANWHIL